MTRTLTLTFLMLIVLGSSATTQTTITYEYPDVVYNATEDGVISAIALPRKVVSSSEPVRSMTYPSNEKIVQIFSFKRQGERKLFDEVIFVGKNEITIFLADQRKKCITPGGIIRSLNWPWVNMVRVGEIAYRYKCEWESGEEKAVSSSITFPNLSDKKLWGNTFFNPHDLECEQIIDSMPSRAKKFCLIKTGELVVSRQTLFDDDNKGTRELVMTGVVAITRSKISHNIFYAMRKSGGLGEIIEVKVSPDGGIYQSRLIYTSTPEEIGSWLVGGELGVYYISARKDLMVFLFAEMNSIPMREGGISAIALAP